MWLHATYCTSYSVISTALIQWACRLGLVRALTKKSCQAEVGGSGVPTFSNGLVGFRNAEKKTDEDSNRRHGQIHYSITHCVTPNTAISQYTTYGRYSKSKSGDGHSSICQDGRRHPAHEQAQRRKLCFTAATPGPRTVLSV